MLANRSTARRFLAKSAPAKIDYRDLFSHSYVCDFIGHRSANSVISTQDEYGHDVWSSYARGDGFLEYCSFSDEVVVVVSTAANGLRGTTIQTATDGDWLHVQYRISGAGNENLADYDPIAVPARSCAIFRYPDGSRTLRDFAPEAWRAVCLYMRPRSVSSFFGIPEACLSQDYRWLASTGEESFRSHLMPIDGRTYGIVHDILNNPFEGAFRRTYLKAKAIELFAHTAYQLRAVGETTGRGLLGGLSEAGTVKAALDIMKSEIETPITLGALAHRVGTNRTRLAELFREHSGTTVQAHWRKLRLELARELLATQRLPVTEVAYRVGYANISSLTRAFLREFSVRPKDFRHSGQMS